VTFVQDSALKAQQGKGSGSGSGDGQRLIARQCSKLNAVNKVNSRAYNYCTKIRYKTVVAMLVVMVALILFVIWKQGRHVKESNRIQIRQDAVEAHRMLPPPMK
jgi:hypothetical protein